MPVDTEADFSIVDFMDDAAEIAFADVSVCETNWELHIFSLEVTEVDFTYPRVDVDFVEIIEELFKNNTFVAAVLVVLNSCVEIAFEVEFCMKKDDDNSASEFELLKILEVVEIVELVKLLGLEELLELVKLLGLEELLELIKILEVVVIVELVELLEVVEIVELAEIIEPAVGVST